jgi:hypothetical protein
MRPTFPKVDERAKFRPSRPERDAPGCPEARCFPVLSAHTLRIVDCRALLTFLVTINPKFDPLKRVPEDFPHLFVTRKL